MSGWTISLNFLGFGITLAQTPQTADPQWTAPQNASRAAPESGRSSRRRHSNVKRAWRKRQKSWFGGK